MRLEYGKVTSVLSDPALGAQLCHVKSQISDREYQNCEIIMTKGITSLPKVGDIVLVSEIHNGEIVVLGSLAQSDLGLAQGELYFYNADKTAGVRFKADGSIQLICQKFSAFDANPAAQQAAITNASTSHGFNSTFDDAELESAANALGTKINSILGVLRTFGFIDT